MRKALLLCALVALGAADQHHGAWRQKTEYRYKVHTKTLAAMPNLKNQWVGVFTKADLTIQPLSKDKLIGKLHNGEYSEWHDALAAGPTQHQSDAKLSYQKMDINEKPFEIRLNDGAVHSIAVDKEMTNIELNQLKSIISQLQVDIHARNFIESPRAHLPQNSDIDDNDNQAIYRVMEPTVTGKCETIYDISRIPLYLAQTYPEIRADMPIRENELVYEVMKNKNYSNCEQRMGYHFGISGLNDWKPNTNLMGSLTKSAISRVILTGDFEKFTIRSSVTTNRVVKANADKENQQDSMVVSQVNVTLASMEENNGKPQVQTENLIDVGNLVYSYDMPSDKKNTLRAKKDSSESEEDDDNEEREYLNNFQKQNNEQDEKKSRWTRSTRKNKDQAEQRRRYKELKEMFDAEEYDNVDNDKEYYQPKPTMNDAPENPMLNFFVGNKGRSIQHSEQFNAPAEVKKMSQEIATDLENPTDVPVKQTLRKFNILSKLIRTMSAEQIKETTQMIMGDNDNENQDRAERTRSVYRDAMTSAGTGPATSEVMKWIEEGKLDGEQAAEVISAIPKNIREPTEEMQKRFFDFVKHDRVKNQWMVNTTAGIAFTRFMFQAQINNRSSSKYYPVESYGRLAKYNSEFVSQEVVPYFARILEEAVNENDAPTTLYAIRALGNLGHADVPKVFEPYFKGNVQVTNFQRLAMVLALDKYSMNYPKEARVMFFQMYQNKGETHEIRSTAIFFLMRVDPTAAFVQRLAEETNYEENRDVRAAARSAIESAARLTAPEHTDLAEKAKAALSLLKPEHQGWQYSRTHLRDYVVREMDAAYRQQSSYIVNKDSFIPNGIFLDTVGNLGGFKRQAEFQATVSSIEQLANNIFDTVWSPKSNSNERQNADDSQGNWSAEKIMKLLNMKQDKAEKLEGQFLLRMMNSERFMTFDKQTLKQMAQKLWNGGKKLRNGFNMKYTKLSNQEDVTISFPLETGLPFTFNYRTPVLLQINGRVSARTTPDFYDNESEENKEKKEKKENRFRVPDTVNVEAEFDAVYSVQNEMTMSFVNPSTRQRYTTGYDKKVQLNVPVRVFNEIDMRNHEIKTEIKPWNENQSTKVLQVGSWPYTARDNVFNLRPLPESKHTKELHGRPIRETNFKFGEKETGFAFEFKGTHEKDSNQLANAIAQLRKHDLTSLLMFGQENTAPEHYAFNVIFDGSKSSSESAKFTLKYSKQTENQPKRENKMHPRARGQLADGSENLAIPVSSEPNSKERREQFMRNAAEGMNASNGADVLDMTLEFNGSKKRAYTATLAGAVSKPEGKARVLAFLQRQQDGEQTRAFHIQADAKYKTAEEYRQQNAGDNKPNADIKFQVSYSLDKTLEVATLRGKVEMKQSAELREVARNMPARQNAIDHIDVVLDMKKAPAGVLESEFSFKFSRLYNFIRYVTLMSMNEDLEYTGDKNKVSFEMRLSPDMQSANFTMKTNNMKSEWNGVNVPKVVKKMAVVPTNWDFVEEAARESIKHRNTCTISGDKVMTFESRTLNNVEFGRTWHLAAHKMRESDDSAKKNKHQVSVLVRDAQNNEQFNLWNSNDQQKNKEVLMVVHQKHMNDITIQLSPSQHGSDKVPRLFVNEKEMDLSNKMTENVYSTENPKQVLARVYVIKHDSKDDGEKDDEEKYEVRVETDMLAGHLEAVYNGKDLKIHSNSLLFRSNNGVCGAFTGQTTTELKTPENRIVRDEKEFIASWALIENSNAHGSLKKMQQHVRDTEYPKEEIIYGNPTPSEKRAHKPKYNKQWENEDDESQKQQRKQHKQQNEHQKDNEERNSDSKHATKHQTQYVEDHEKSRICFSKRPLPVCAPGTRANGKMTQKVEVYCRHSNDPAAQHYKLQIQSGRNLDMSNYDANDKIKFTVPKRCERA